MQVGTYKIELKNCNDISGFYDEATLPTFAVSTGEFVSVKATFLGCLICCLLEKFIFYHGLGLKFFFVIGKKLR
ncbi:MAG: hypothetical protein ACK559_09175, partial [bacterium]